MAIRRITAERLKGPLWTDIVAAHDIAGMLERGELCPDHIRALDQFLHFLDLRANPEMSVETIVEWTRDHRSSNRIYALKRACEVLFEPGPIHLAINRACNEISGRFQPRTKQHIRRARKFSVYPDELPEQWTAALVHMEAGLPGVDIAAPAASFIQTTWTKLCELARTCRDSGIAATISVETLIAHEKALYARVRKLSPRTICTALRHIRDFARYIGADDVVYHHLAQRFRYWENKANLTPALKESKAFLLPSYTEIFERVFDLLGRSDVGDPLERQRCRNHAVALALMCAFPLRLADTQLRFGHEILWDGRCYALDIVTSKTKAKVQPVLLSIFGHFIDQLVLQGANVIHLDAMREEVFRERRHLFVDYAGHPLHAGYVSYAWRQVLGTGCHIARSKIHDEFASLGQEGVELAMAACTHRSQKTAEFYRSRAYELLSVRGAHDRVSAAITEDEWARYLGN